MTKSLAVRAERFARNAHGSAGQKRKYSGDPYAVHLAAVAETVASVTGDEETIAAAWLHDVLEDTSVEPVELRRRFGGAVADLVTELTDVSRHDDGNRKARKELDRQHLAEASPRAQTVKLADLIDNCRDITRHDPKFARVYLEEMKALLEVLTDGDGSLLTRARTVWVQCAAAVGLDTAAAPGTEPAPSGTSMQRRMRKLLNEGIPAAYIAEALPSFDGEQPAAAVRAILEEAGIPVAGVRIGGYVAGYVTGPDLDDGTCKERLRSFEAKQVVFGDTPLSRVIAVLSRFEHCFVEVLGSVGAVIGREDFQKPPVRMWLFGMVTILEMFLARAVEERYPGDSWTSELSASRLEKARALLEERRAQGQHPTLLDCLQLSDKGRIVTADPEARANLRFGTKRDGRRALKALESLRNNLAHAQDIVTNDWETIVLIARQVDRIVSRLR